MPEYGGSGQATLLRENQQRFLWQAESVPTGVLSVAFELARVNRAYYPWGLSFEVSFSGNPGTFEIDLMAANNDLPANYVSMGSITAVNAGFVGRFDMPLNIWPKYISAVAKTLTRSAVLVTLQVTR